MNTNVYPGVVFNNWSVPRLLCALCPRTLTTIPKLDWLRRCSIKPLVTQVYWSLYHSRKKSFYKLTFWRQPNKGGFPVEFVSSHGFFLIWSQENVLPPLSQVFSIGINITFFSVSKKKRHDTVLTSPERKLQIYSLFRSKEIDKEQAY